MKRGRILPVCYYLMLYGNFSLKITSNVHLREIERYLLSIPGAHIINSDFCKEYSIEILFAEKEVNLKIKEKKYTFSGGILSSHDIYPLILFAIYSLYKQHNFLLLHSVVVECKNIGILIIGNFGQGKTTLGLAFENCGYCMVSADQTIVGFSNDQVYALASSNIVRINNTEYCISGIKSNIQIKKIIFIDGLCYGGDNYIKSIHQKHIILKRLWNAATWPWNTPLYITMSSVYNNTSDIFDLCDMISSNSLAIYTVRGDPHYIAELLSK